MNLRTCLGPAVFAILFTLFGNLTTWANGPVRTEFQETTLSILKATLLENSTTLPDYQGDDLIPITDQASKTEYRLGIRRAMQLYEQLSTWLLLADSEPSSQTLSTDFKRMRDHEPLCVRRLLLETLDDTLAQISSPLSRRVALAVFFSSNLFSRQPQSGFARPTTPALLNLSLPQPLPSFYKGTRSENSLSPELTENLAFLKNIWSLRTPFFSAHEMNFEGIREASDIVRKRYQEQLEEIFTQTRCLSSPIRLALLFPFADFDVSSSLFKNSKKLSDKKWAEEIQSFVTTTQMPSLTGLTPQSQIQAVTSYALRPVPGLLLSPRLVSPSFYKLFLNLLHSTAFKGGEITPENCLETYRLAAWVDFFGLKIPLEQEERERVGIRFEELRSSYQIIIGMLSARQYGHPNWNSCLGAVTAIQQIWNSQIDLKNALIQIDENRRRGFEPWRESGTALDQIPIGNIIGRVIGFGKSVKEGVGSLPDIQMKIHFPTEWPVSSSLNAHGFAIEAVRPNKNNTRTPVPQIREYNEMKWYNPAHIEHW